MLERSSNGFESRCHLKLSFCPIFYIPNWYSGILTATSLNRNMKLLVCSATEMLGFCVELTAVETVNQSWMFWRQVRVDMPDDERQCRCSNNLIKRSNSKSYPVPMVLSLAHLQLTVRWNPIQPPSRWQLEDVLHVPGGTKRPQLFATVSNERYDTDTHLVTKNNRYGPDLTRHSLCESGSSSRRCSLVWILSNKHFWRCETEWMLAIQFNES